MEENKSLLFEVGNKVLEEASENDSHWLYGLDQDSKINVLLKLKNELNDLGHTLSKEEKQTIIYRKVYRKDEYKKWCPHCHKELSDELASHSYCAYCGGALQTKDDEKNAQLFASKKE